MDAAGLTEAEKARHAAAPIEPTLLICGPLGRWRVFIPPEAVKILGDDFEALAFMLARRQIDRLPWPVEPEDGASNFCHDSPVLRRR